MALTLEISPDSITAYLSGEIDHHSAAYLREKIDDAIEKNSPEELIMDFSGITFMDSSGIGLVMGRYRLMAEIGGQVTITGLDKSTQKVMKIAGLEKIVKFAIGGKNKNENSK